MADPGFLTLEDAAKAAGHARWVETRLFEALGSWVGSETEPRAKAFWAARSRIHGLHAQGWHDRQPRVAHLDPDSLTTAPGPEVEALFDSLAGFEATGLRMAALARVVLPALVAAYRDRVARAHPLADGPTVRWATAVVGDEEDARMALEEMLAARPADAKYDTASGLATPSGDLVPLANAGSGLLGLTGIERHGTL